MPLHQRISAMLSLFFLALSSAFADPASDARAWWSEATRAYAKASGLEAGRTRIRIEELNQEGSVTSYESGETVAEWIGSERRVSVVKAEKNGKDVSAAWRKRYERSSTDGTSGASRKGGTPSGFDATPFDPKYAASVTLGTPKTAGGFFELPYTIAVEGGDIEGVAVFTASGKPRSAVQEWVSPPTFVSSMRSSLVFAYEGETLVVSGMEIAVNASILFVKKRFRMSFEFSEWKRPPQDQGLSRVRPCRPRAAAAKAPGPRCACGIPRRRGTSRR